MTIRVFAAGVLAVLVLAGWLVYGGDRMTLRPIDGEGRLVQGCQLSSTKRAGLGLAAFGDMAYSTAEGAPSIDTGRGWNRIRVTCPGRPAVRTSVVVLRGRSNVFNLAVPTRG